MKHSYIQESNLIERYLAGKLTPSEEGPFEEHLIDCQECLDRLETINRFRRGLRTAAAEDDPVTVPPKAMPAAWQSLPRRSWYVAILALMVVSVPAITYFLHMRQVERELAQTRTAYADLQHQYQEQKELVDRLKAGLSHPSNQGEDPHSPASLPVFTLAVVRGAGTEESSPANEITVSRRSPWVILSLDLEPDPQAQSYRAVILQQGKPINWQAENLKAGVKDTIAVSVRRDLLQSGNYALRLESCPRQGRCYPSATYAFRVASVD
jgi:hypothetical protein